MAALRVLLTHPFFWPHVRRGAEREVHDLGASLAARGHRVRLLTGTPDALTRATSVDGVRVRYVRLPAGREVPAFAAPTAVAAALSRADVVTTFLYGDGAGAAVAKRLRRARPVVLKLTGTVRAARIAERPVHDRLLRTALAGVDEVWCNSRFAADEMAEFGVPMRVVPAGLETGRFAYDGPRAAGPVVFVASAADEPRKRLVDLIDAWPAVLDAEPAARLRIAGHASPQTRADLLSRLPGPATAAVEFLGLLDDAALAAELGRAWVVAMPAVYEALGLVTLEALSCGTPVAGARSGATPELVGDCGALFEPASPADCARAVVETLRRAGEPGLRERCRARAAPYDQQRVTDLVEARYRALIKAR